MKIELKSITIAELAKNFKDDKEGGVTGYSGKLDIRPPYQREFVYKDKQRAAVINTVLKGFPLNVMYWSVREDGTFEIIDGQQRTISICQYINGDFSVENLYIQNRPVDEQRKINDYQLTVYLCSGTDSERLDWFRTINIAGEKLTEQELRNAVYAGPWVSDAKRYFSRSNCPAQGLASAYMAGAPIRQDYFETVINWISNGSIEHHMATHQFDKDAEELWNYFQKVIAWVQGTFTNYRSEMKGLPWGEFFNKYKNVALDSVKLEARLTTLMEDDDVSNKRGIYAYLLTNDERHLNIRAFDNKQKREAYERQKGICVKCKKKFSLEEMEADHITPWSKKGKTAADNCQMLCKEDNRRKSNA
jgi:hypothetical protein